MNNNIKIETIKEYKNGSKEIAVTRQVTAIYKLTNDDEISFIKEDDSIKNKNKNEWSELSDSFWDILHKFIHS
jgi:hypothetical protein